MRSTKDINKDLIKQSNSKQYLDTLKILLEFGIDSYERPGNPFVRFAHAMSQSNPRFYADPDAEYGPYLRIIKKKGISDDDKLTQLIELAEKNVKTNEKRPDKFTGGMHDIISCIKIEEEFSKSRTAKLYADEKKAIDELYQNAEASPVPAKSKSAQVQGNPKVDVDPRKSKSAAATVTYSKTTVAQPQNEEIVVPRKVKSAPLAASSTVTHDAPRKAASAKNAKQRTRVDPARECLVLLEKIIDLYQKLGKPHAQEFDRYLPFLRNKEMSVKDIEYQLVVHSTTGSKTRVPLHQIVCDVDHTNYSYKNKLERIFKDLDREFKDKLAQDNPKPDESRSNRL